jgi:hypothetical protein
MAILTNDFLTNAVLTNGKTWRKQVYCLNEWEYNLTNAFAYYSCNSCNLCCHTVSKNE